MIDWPKYTLSDAETDFEKLSVHNMTDDSRLEDEFTIIRKKILEAVDEIYEEHNFDAGINNKYMYDLKLGLVLYEILKSKIDLRDVNNDDNWRYLSLRVIPDVVHPRWGIDPNRFYKNGRRIYLKQIWWYIHLSWNNDLMTTFETLKNNTTDTIQGIVERPGVGYYTDLYREIMRQYSNYKDYNRTLMRRVLILNTARLKVVSPELVEGGITQYVKSLFEAVLE